MRTENLKGTLRHYMELRHIRSFEQLRTHTSVGSNTTFLKYLKYPDLMPLGVFFQLMKSLNVPMDEQMKLLREDK